MTSDPHRPSVRVLLVLATVAVLTQAGCTTLALPPLTYGLAPKPPDFRNSDGTRMQHSVSEQMYHAVRQARAENGIVLHVVEDGKSPIRVLPLPPQDKSVFVSDLITQTGVQQKFGTIEATLYRHTTNSIGGLPMEVKMSADFQKVMPQSDYALQPGDRLEVRRKKVLPLFEQMVKNAIGI